MYEKQLEAFGRLLGVMDELRERCPWDREQTFESLRNNTIEETFELVDAITSGDMDNIREELGDMLLHIVFYSKMGDEQKQFDIADVANSLCDKLIYRHPHVFGNVEATTSGQVIHNWELLKLAERKKKERKGRGGVLSGVPRSLPAMVKAYRIGEKAAAAGFDWEKREDVWAKVKEEIAEFENELTGARHDPAKCQTSAVNTNHDRMESEMGDIFFALVNAARLYGIDPETALEKCNRKFIRRFEYIEAKTAETGNSLADMQLAEMEEYWQEAKMLEK